MKESKIKENYHQILTRIQKASADSPYHRQVTLVAVSKTHPVRAIMEVYEEGQRDFGENKAQELADKYEKMPKDIRWHMIGHLQTNKVKYIIDKVCMIHSVDSLKLAQVIDKEAEKHQLVMPVLIEVNIGKEESKSGISAEELVGLVQELAQLQHIKVRGLMCIPPYADTPENNQKYFEALRNLSIDIKERNIDNISMDILSMGMSDDFETAVSEGADIVRVGTGIFGEREYNL